MQCAVLTYELARKLPRNEEYGLASQLRRAAVSIPSNIAEGHQQQGKNYRRFVVMALGSVAELQTQLDIAERVGLVSSVDVEPVRALSIRVRQVLHGLKRSLPNR